MNARELLSKRQIGFVLLFLLALFVLCTRTPSIAQDSPTRQTSEINIEKRATTLVTKETQKTIDDGLKFLAKQQNDDGSMGRYRNVAISALTGLSFLASGSTPDRGPYGKEITRCTEFILKNTQESGFISSKKNSSHGPMYGHGFATLYLAEVQGMSANKNVKAKLTAAVQLIIKTQNNEGGWRYQPARRDADISVTVCQVMALRAAKNAGVYVPAETIDRAIEYVKKCQNADGGFMYMATGGESMFPRSAAGVVALYSAGIYEGKEIENGLKYLGRFQPKGKSFNRDAHYFYGHYYAVQAMWHSGGKRWQRWYPAIRDALIERQQKDGAWMDGISPEYGTAMACIILQIPNNMLPIFQR